jgi:hypothetical protein
LVLAAQNRIDYKTFLFSNVGDDSENPDTLDYYHEIALPYAAANGLELLEIFKVKRDGSRDTLMDNIMRTQRSIPIPVRVANGMPGRRNCTGTFKIDVVAKWLKKHGATADSPATLGLGISMDEFKRMRNASGFDFYALEYPLIDLRFTRKNCLDVIQDAGLPAPPKSACWFCPFHRNDDWKELRASHPDLFQKSVELERHLNERRANLGKDNIFFSSRRKPLDEAYLDDDSSAPDTACESGYCML